MKKISSSTFYVTCCVSYRYKMTSDKFVHRLVVPSVRLSDVGEYTAVAGSSMSKGQLGVEGRDIKISEPASRDITVSSYSSNAVRIVWSLHRLYLKFKIKD